MATVDVEGVGKAFVQHYYNTFDGNRVNLRALYQPQSMLTWEGQRFQGVDAIHNKLMGFSSNVQHAVASTDVQPVPTGVILVCVAGHLSVDQDNPLKFSQVFTLAPTSTGSYFILNDLFRLLYG
ncbi:nuclear transport factor 2 [Pelomyxa schiedti]|nr:nuclear transport factor 2 [Pelomyxa schiedti]